MLALVTRRVGPRQSNYVKFLNRRRPTPKHWLQSMHSR